MNIESELYLLRLYLHEYIDRMKPVALDYQISIYAKKGYIEDGHNGHTFPDFKTWKRIREMFPIDTIDISHSKYFNPDFVDDQSLYGMPPFQAAFRSLCISKEAAELFRISKSYLNPIIVPSS